MAWVWWILDHLSLERPHVSIAMASDAVNNEGAFGLSGKRANGLPTHAPCSSC